MRITKYDANGAVKTSLATIPSHDHSGAGSGGQLNAGTAFSGGTLPHERGGLEADVSAYAGLLKISGGATSQVTAPTGDIVGTTDSQTLTNKNLTTPTIASFANAGHNHQDAAGGGTLAKAAISDFDEGVDDRVSSLFAYGSGLRATYNDAGNTYTQSQATRVCDGRLTLTSGTPITTADVTGATNVYFALFRGNRLSLYDGVSDWLDYAFTELTLAVPASTNTNYDVFVYDNAGTLTLEAVAWTNDTTRATALTTQDGVLVKSGAATHRYLGSFRTTAVSGQTEDSANRRFLVNYYNPVTKYLNAKDTTNQWNYTTGSWRAANNSTTVGTSRVEILIGWSEQLVSVVNNAFSFTSSATPGAGIGIDSTSVNSALSYSTSWAGGPAAVIYEGYPGVGYHYLQAIEYGATGVTFYGDVGTTIVQTGLIAKVAA